MEKIGRMLLVGLILCSLCVLGCGESGQTKPAEPQKYPWGYLKPLPSDTYPKFQVNVNYNRDVADLMDGMRNSGLQWSNPRGGEHANLTSKNFPMKLRGQADVEILLVSFNQPLDLKGVLSELSRKGLRPANFHEASSLYSNMKTSGFGESSSVAMVVLGTRYKNSKGQVEAVILYNDSRSNHIAWVNETANCPESVGGMPSEIIAGCWSYRKTFYPAVRNVATSAKIK